MTMPVDRSRLIFPALGGLYDVLAQFSYTLIRFAAGAILVPHGVQKLVYGTAANTAKGLAAKGFPFPLELAYFVGFVELFVAAAVAIGLFTRLSAAILTVHMAVITIVFTGPNGYFWARQGYEFSLLWMLLFLAIMFRGGGRCSVDRYLPKEF
jgi:putative oxidoreductase